LEPLGDLVGMLGKLQVRGRGGLREIGQLVGMVGAVLGLPAVPSSLGLTAVEREQLERVGKSLEERVDLCDPHSPVLIDEELARLEAEVGVVEERLSELCREVSGRVEVWRRGGVEVWRWTCDWGRGGAGGCLLRRRERRGVCGEWGGCWTCRFRGRVRR
jgi:hypothetical protein